MSKTNSPVTRRTFLKTTAAAAAGVASLPLTTYSFMPPQKAKYVRYNVMSDRGKRAIESYAKGVREMLKLPASHPQNWFRNSFVHLMDCPHGNWWFYVWHRGYLGYFEETIRNLSGDKDFAIPYWDWTTLPEIPRVMFDDFLTPTDKHFEPYTDNLAVFTSFIQPALMSYWNTLSTAQRNQLNVRGYTQFDLMWNDVTGFTPSVGQGVSGNMGYANTCGARYLSRDNPKLDDKTAYAVSPFMIYSGLVPTDFYNPDITLSFNSAKTPSHNTPPGQNSFSVLEGFPHNKVHNYIGGVGPVDPGPYGNMTNFLSPVDPIFFLHHSNMDRLWDVWTRKQQLLGLPFLPDKEEMPTYSKEPFLFYVDGQGKFVGDSKAGEYISMAKFDYEYEPGFGDDLTNKTSSKLNDEKAGRRIRGAVRGNKATLTVPTAAIREHLAEPAAASLVADVTLPHPSPNSPTREFDVLVGAPPGVTSVDAKSPYYAGTISFFGNMSHVHAAASEAHFAVPLPKAPQAFKSLEGLEAVNSTVEIRIVPTHGRGRAPVVRSATIRSLE